MALKWSPNLNKLRVQNFSFLVHRRLWRLQIQNSVPARTFHCGVSVNINPSSSKLYAQKLIHLWDVLVDYICFTHERCNMSSINKKSTRVVAAFLKKPQNDKQSICTPVNSSLSKRMLRSKIPFDPSSISALVTVSDNGGTFSCIGSVFVWVNSSATSFDKCPEKK